MDEFIRTEGGLVKILSSGPMIVFLIALCLGCEKSEVASLLKDQVDASINANAKSGLGIDENEAIIAHYSFDEDLGDWPEKSVCCSFSAELQGNTKRFGTRAAKFELRRQEMPNGPRAEFGQSPNKNTEGWFGFSLYFPSSFIEDPIEESVAQWNCQPDFLLGETWRSPPMLLGILKDRFVLEIRTDTARVTVQPNYTFTRIDLGPVDKEVWHDWVFHIKWAYDQSGILEVWKDKKLILSRVGQANCFNDMTSPYFKIGLYKWDWTHATNTVCQSRTLFVDEVTIGNAKANFEKVSPFQVSDPLPVRLISFAAVRKLQEAHLSWATSEESNSDHFVVERSADAVNWHSIGKKSSAGESGSMKKYVFMDLNPIKGQNYYRLKTVDKDSSSTYSSIRNLRF